MSTMDLLGPNVLFVLFGAKIGRIRPNKHYVFSGQFPNLSPKYCSSAGKQPKRTNRRVTGGDWTGSPNKSIDQLGKNCPKNVRKLCFRPLRTNFRNFSDIFQHFSDVLSTFCFTGLCNDLPVTQVHACTGGQCQEKDLEHLASGTQLYQLYAEQGSPPKLHERTALWVALTLFRCRIDVEPI